MNLRGLFLWNQNFLSKTYGLSALLITVVVFSSCLKQTVDTPTERKLTVAFADNTLQFGDIDSGAVVLTRQGAVSPYYLRFQKSTDRMEIDLEDFRTGNWTVQMVIYTKKNNDGRSNQFNASLQFVAEQISGIVVLAPPKTNASTVWKKSEVLATSDNEIIAVIPHDVTNPAFEIRVKSMQWDEVVVERAVYKRTGGMNELLGEASWSCTAGCFGADRIIYNTQAFAAFAEQNKSRLWNNADVTIIVKDKDLALNNEFYFPWNKE